MLVKLITGGVQQIDEFRQRDLPFAVRASGDWKIKDFTSTI